MDIFENLSQHHTTPLLDTQPYRLGNLIQYHAEKSDSASFVQEKLSCKQNYRWQRQAHHLGIFCMGEALINVVFLQSKADQILSIHMGDWDSIISMG